MAQGLTTKIALELRPSHFTTPGLSEHPARTAATNAINENPLNSKDYEGFAPGFCSWEIKEANAIVDCTKFNVRSSCVEIIFICITDSDRTITRRPWETFFNVYY